MKRLCEYQLLQSQRKPFYDPVISHSGVHSYVVQVQNGSVYNYIEHCLPVGPWSTIFTLSKHSWYSSRVQRQVVVSTVSSSPYWFVVLNSTLHQISCHKQILLRCVTFKEASQYFNAPFHLSIKEFEVCRSFRTSTHVHWNYKKPRVFLIYSHACE